MTGWSVIVALAAWAGNGDVTWEKSRVAEARSQVTGKPVCWYFTVNSAKVGGAG